MNLDSPPLIIVGNPWHCHIITQMHPTLRHEPPHLLMSKAIIAVCPRYKGAVCYVNEGDGEANLFIIGRLSVRAWKNIIPVAGILGYKKCVVKHDRRGVNLLCDIFGFTPSKAGWLERETGA
jgi:hypothetical protein